MKTRATLALAAVAGLAGIVNAQETFQVFYTWQEVVGGSTVAVTGSAANSILEPGEGARIRIGVQALVNGSSAVGAVVNLTSPISGFSNGTVRGLGSAVYDLVGDGGAASASGNWTNILGPGSVLTAGGTGGFSASGGAILQNFGGQQFIAPGGSANAANPGGPLGTTITRSVWQPASYANRTVNFLGRGSVNVPSGQQNAVLVAYSVNQPDPQDPATWNDNLVGKYFGTTFGQGLNIPIAPAPSSVALLGLGALIAGRRRR